jgi:hypothetical protein
LFDARPNESVLNVEKGEEPLNNLGETEVKDVGVTNAVGSVDTNGAASQQDLGLFNNLIIKKVQ